MTQFTLSAIDLPTLHRNALNRAIGFDRIFNELERNFSNSRADNSYPPYNISKLDDTHYVVEVAVAGFKETELDVELKEGMLTIRGEQVKSEPETEVDYLHKGISNRNFTRQFNLADTIEVRGATVQNGILAIALEQIIPEEKKPKKIEITFAK